MQLYQPGIWHSSRTRKISRAWYFSLYLLERVYCDKGAKTATKVRRLRQKCEAGCEPRIDIFDIPYRRDIPRHARLILRNNKTAFHLLECRFSGNPLYQPGIWTPSRTTSLNGYSVGKLYQPEIWTLPRTAGHRQLEGARIVSTWDLTTFEDSCVRERRNLSIVSPWDLDTLEDIIFAAVAR